MTGPSEFALRDAMKAGMARGRRAALAAAFKELDAMNDLEPDTLKRVINTAAVIRVVNAIVREQEVA